MYKMEDYANKIYSLEEDQGVEWYEQNGGLETLLIDSIGNKIKPKSFWSIFKDIYTNLEFLHPYVMASDYLMSI